LRTSATEMNMEPLSTFKITCTWLTGGATELPVVFISPDGSGIFVNFYLIIIWAPHEKEL